MKSRDERLQEYMRIRALLPQAKEALMRYPGVRDVSVGLKETDDLATEVIAFRVAVEAKMAPKELARGAMIPKEVLGVRTDVVLESTTSLAGDEDTDAYRPLQGGIQIGNDTTGGHGTLGAIAQLVSDHSIVALSCHHVMLDGGAAVGEKIGQPGISCCCCCKSGVVGEVINALDNTLVDCAIARITGQPGFTNEVVGIGLLFGAAPLNLSGSTVVIGDVVMKRGRSTGFTMGTVLDPAANTTKPGGAIDKTNQILIKPDPGFKRFGYYGDSGSVVVNDQNQVVGLLYSIDKATETNGYANVITNVMTAMSIAIINSGTTGTIPLGAQPTGALDDEPVQLREADDAPLAPLLRGLKESGTGRLALAFFNRHGHEINRLLETNRQVKVSWHRYQGPAFTAHAIKSAREPDHRIPAAIEGVASANLLLRMSVVLQEEGSAELAAAVAEQTVPLLNLIDGCDSVQALLERVRAMDAEGASAEPALHADAV